MVEEGKKLLEQIRDLGEFVVRLEAYRTNIVHSSTWPVYGLITCAGVLIIWAAFLLTNNPILWSLVVIPLVAATVLYGWIHEKYSPKYLQEKSWRMIFTYGVPFTTIYIVGGLLADLFNIPPVIKWFLYSSVFWYVALGVGLALTGIFVERDVVRRGYLVFNSTLMVGSILLLTSPLLIALPLVLGSIEVLPLIGGFLALSLTLIAYLIGYLICLERAHMALMGARK